MKKQGTKLSRAASLEIIKEQNSAPKASKARANTFARVRALAKELKRQGFTFDEEPVGRSTRG